MLNLCLSDLRTTRARLLDMFTDSTCTPEIMKKSSDEYFALLQGLCTVIFPLWSDISVLLRLLFFSLICIYSAQRHVVCCCYRIHFAAGWNHTREQAPVHPELQMEWHFTGKYCKVTQKEPELIHNVVLWFSTVVLNCFPFLGPIFYISSTGEKKSCAKVNKLVIREAFINGL